MSRSDTRSEDFRSVNPGAGANDARTGVGRYLPSADTLKRDARQALNTAEYEFRKLVSASRTAPSPQETDQAPAQEKTPPRKQEAATEDPNQG